MKRMLIAIILVFAGALVYAQKTDTLTMAVRESTSMEQLLGLPSVYTVVDCDIIINKGNGSIFRRAYNNSNGKAAVKFNEYWRDSIKLAEKGDKVVISEIVVVKDGVRGKIAGKIFIVP